MVPTPPPFLFTWIHPLAVAYHHSFPPKCVIIVHRGCSLSRGQRFFRCSRWLYSIGPCFNPLNVADSGSKGDAFQSFCFPGQVLQSPVQRSCWGASKPWQQMALFLPCLSWHSGCPGPDRDSSSCCACASTTGFSRWWTSTTARCWPTSPSPPLIARASTSTAPCLALWAQLPFSSRTPSGIRRTSTPFDFSA